MLPGLVDYPQFIIWKLIQRKGEPKPDKVSVDPVTQLAVNAHDPKNWMSFDAANLVKPEGCGVGFVFTENDPFFFLDLDGCRQGDSWTPLALSLCRRFQGAAIEVSQSGTGLHIIGSAGHVDHCCKNIQLGLELYTEKRFVALTGQGVMGDASTVHDLSLTVAEYFPPSAACGSSIELTDVTDPEWSGPEDDDDLISMMLGSKSSAAAVFGDRATVVQLWNADVEALGNAYPDENREFDASSADAALCQHLAFWTGRNSARIERLFNRSALVRDKWQQREDYRLSTIRHAVANCNAVLKSKRNEPTAVATDSSAEVRNDSGYLTVTDQTELFKACVYVQDQHRVYSPEGFLLKPDQFKVEYGGYVFALDANNDKTTRNAWEAFTESQAVRHPRARSVCFRPECEPGRLIKEEGQTLVNIYKPIETERTPGDVTRFTDHVAKLFPNDRDRSIILAYMAAVVQHPGVKFQWCPIMQGCEGNGKTLLVTAVANAVGNRYTHLPNAQDLGGNGSKFTLWIQQKLFIGIEEIYTSDKRDTAEALKPMITNRRIEIQGKGADQVMGDNRANFLACSNHKDMVRKQRTDRRYAVMYSAQQTLEDLDRDGMSGGYFPSLYRWADGGGYAVITDYLKAYQIPDELNPATSCQRAPDTSSTAEALALSLGPIEQSILEAVDECRPGFCGGWLSSMAITRMLDSQRRKCAPNTLKKIIEDLGYIYHPAFKKGRSTVITQIDGGKPRLYCEAGSVAANYTDGGSAAKAYEAAQTSGSVAANVFNESSG